MENVAADYRMIAGAGLIGASGMTSANMSLYLGQLRSVVVVWPTGTGMRGAAASIRTAHDMRVAER